MVENWLDSAPMKQTILMGAAISIMLGSCGDNSKELMSRANQIFKPIPAKMPGFESVTAQQVELGRKLYTDVRLSVNDSQSCNSCHRIDEKLGGVDNEKFSDGALEGKKGGRNAPTTLNAGFHLAQFWDGRAADLTAQAKGPVLNPVEMAMASAKAVEAKLGKVKEYGPLFKEAFPDAKTPVTFDNMALAIAAFESTLISKDRFDDFLKGDSGALNSAEQKGLDTFMKVGCIQCHNGALIGGNSYQKMGKMNPYSNTSDQGRFTLTKSEADRFVFKVPSLRNIALTAPYFHDGGASTLDEAVRQMGKLQLNKDLSADEVNSIVSFLKALTDKERAK